MLTQTDMIDRELLKELKAWQKSNGKLYDICDLLVEAGLSKSRSDAKRLIEQKAVKIDNEIIDDYKTIITFK